MKERDTIRPKADPPRGVLNVPAGQAARGLSRYWPSSDLAPFVEHYWVVRWDLPAPLVAETVPHPSVHLVLEPGRSEIVGVMRSRFSRRLEGRGRVVGTKFLPGAFRAFVRRPVSAFTDARPPATAVFGRPAASLEAEVLAHDDDGPGLALVEAFLRACEPREDDAMILVRGIAARIAEDRGITRVDQIVRESGLPLRRLQRVFNEYAGVGPKWVIQRYRLLDAAERVAAGARVAWADLALELGYADQAHFIRDFKKLVGRTPAGYARDLGHPDRPPR